MSYNACQSGHAGEFHPCVPTEPYVNLSITPFGRELRFAPVHTVLPVQSQMYKNIMDIPIPNREKAVDFPDTFYEAS